MHKLSQTTRHIFLLLFLLVAVMSSLILGSSVMKWDAVDLYLPWKFFTTECLANGELPLWNPYINGGFAQMGDPGTWYPVSWVLSFFTGGYTLWTLHFEYLLHLYLAGCGFYYLSKKLGITADSAVLIGAAYMLSGVMIGNAQHVGWVVSAAWIPWVFVSFKSLLENRSIRDSLRVALFLFLLLSGGYPGFFIIVCYLLLIYALFKIYNQKMEWSAEYWKKIITSSALFVFVFILLSGIILYASFEMSAHITRGTGLNERSDVWNTLIGSIYPSSTQTIMFPLMGSQSDWDYWNADISMVNLYMGALLIFILLVALTTKKLTRKVHYLIAIGIVFILLSFGQTFPFRNWLSNLPFMDFFRFPSLFRLFFMFCLLLAAGFSLDHILKSASRRHLLISIAIGIFLFGLFNLITISEIERWKFLKIFSDGWLYFTELAGKLEFGFLQSGIIIFLLTGLIFVAWKYHRHFKLALSIAVLLELFLFTRMQLHATVFKKDKTISLANSGVVDAPVGFPIPNLTEKIGENTDILEAKHFKFLWRNLSVFRKKVSQDGYSPYSYVHTNKAIKSGEYERFSKYPLVFFCSSLGSNYEVLGSTVDTTGCSLIKILQFTPNKVSIKSQLAEDGYLILNQNYYPHWTAEVNNKPVEMIRVSDAFMAIPLKKGNHFIQFHFHARIIQILVILNIMTLIAVTFLLILPTGKIKRNKHFHENIE